MGCPHNFKGDAINTQAPIQNSLKIDYFLYSCFEFEQTCKAFPSKAISEQRWPEVVKILEAGEATEPKSLVNLAEQLEASLSWYAQQFPELETETRIEYENIGAIASATVFFSLDLKILARQQPEALESIRSETAPLWTDIERMVTAHAGHFAKFFMAFLRWTFVKTEERYWEAGDRPPVGRYTPGARRSNRPDTGALRGPSRGGPPGRSFDRDRGPRRDGGDKGGRSGSRDRPDRGGERDRGDKGRTRPPRDPRGGGSHADQELAAIETVKIAIDKLREDKSLAEVRLDPSNSFFRRLQHKKAVADGYHSYSTGEGNGRSVVVTREKPANEDAE